MDSKEFDLPDSFKALYVNDADSDKVTVVLTKTVNDSEVNFALDFPSSHAITAFIAWLEIEAGSRL